jgi:hypothetical protein
MNLPDVMEAVQRLVGLYTGQLTPEELELFEMAVGAGRARRDYSGPGGFLGLSKVALVEPQP